MPVPTECQAVTWEMRDENYSESACDAQIGDLLWNPKMGEGHVLTAEARCGSTHEGRHVDCGCGGWGLQPCASMTLICQCGKDGAARDHHYRLLARPR